MRVSKTELTALLKQTFEGLGFSPGDCQNAADMVIWAEMTGLEGLRELREALPYLQDTDRPAVQCVSEEDAHKVMDARSNSSLVCADLAINTARANALAHGEATVTLLNCHNRKLVARLLMDCGQLGLSCMAYWRNGSDPVIQHVVSVHPEANSPCLPLYSSGCADQNSAMDKEHCQSLFIVCAKGSDKVSDKAARLLLHAGVDATRLRPDELQANYDAALNQGIAMDEQLWGDLLLLSQSVLVESSEQSRKGAGE